MSASRENLHVRDICTGLCEKCNELFLCAYKRVDTEDSGSGEVGFRMGTAYTEPANQSGKTDGRQTTPPRPLYVGEKEKYVREMFAAIAPRYDLLNDLLSFRSHKRWRRLAVRMAQVAPGDHCLDVCT